MRMKKISEVKNNLKRCSMNNCNGCTYERSFECIEKLTHDALECIEKLEEGRSLHQSPKATAPSSEGAFGECAGDQ